MSKYSIAKDAIAEARRKAGEDGIDVGDTIEALIILALQESVAVRGAKLTRQSLVYEMSNMAGDVDFDFVRSR